MICSNRDDPRILKLGEWTKKYGKTYGIMEGATRMVITSDLELVSEAFIKQFDNFYSRKGAILGSDVDKDQNIHLFLARGARWKQLRNISAPSFSITALKKIRPIVEDSVLNMVRIMEDRHLDGEAFNIHDFYCEYTTDTIGRLVMGQKESMYFRNPRVEVVKKIILRDFDMSIVHLRYAFPWITPVLRKIVRKLPSLTSGIFRLRAEIRSAVEERMKNRESNPGIEDEDFIDLFLNAHDDGAEIGIAGDCGRSEAKVDKSLTIDEVVSQAMVFILAGFDTTANALVYTTWMLACNPGVMRKCQGEIDEVCGEESISYEDINNLRYLEAVCKETLRFFPLAALLAVLEEKMALAHLLRRFDFLKGTEASELRLHGAMTLTPVEVPIRIVKRE